MRLINAFKKLSINKWRYIFWIIGLIMFVAPFALLTRLIYFTIGNIYPPDLHGICFRMPFEWIFSGRIFYLFQYPIMFGTVILALIIAFVLGPIFCGWLCPVGAVSEALSKIIPFPYRLRIKDTSITRSLRYGFLAGWIVISLLIGLGYIGISSICCRYCASSVLQSLVDAISSSTVLYWHSGSIIVLIFWLIIGGVFTVGGRAWCIMFCPLGAMSGLFHSLGAKLGFYRTIRRNNVKCNNCDICMKVCPMWAIDSNKSIDRTLCINCKECVKRCPNNAFTMVWREIN
ncbi:MAG: 4Fe-4S binding protein [Nitrososphaerota archaeon]|nr:4Fe-4S binding protein [Nitrososphaerota archaeon]